MAKDRYGFGTEEFDTKLNTAFKVAIRRELNPPKDQGHDRHLDNLKAIREYALEYPEHFYQFINMEEESGDLKKLKDHLTTEFAKYGGDDVNSLMWGSDENNHLSFYPVRG